jgi:peptide deformylase
LLTQVSADVSVWNADLSKLARDMIETMYSARGVGLAAIQVGVPLRICVVDIRPKNRQPRVLINPKIRRQSGSAEGLEGCLSYPGFEGRVARAAHVALEAFDLEKKNFRISARELLARVLQHELDHLDGIMFMQKALPGTLKLVEKPVAF